MMMRFAIRVAFRCAVALLCATSALPKAALKNKGEIDPGAVSDWTIFSYSSGNKSTRERLNTNTITVTCNS